MTQAPKIADIEKLGGTVNNPCVVQCYPPSLIVLVRAFVNAVRNPQGLLVVGIASQREVWSRPWTLTLPHLLCLAHLSIAV